MKTVPALAAAIVAGFAQETRKAESTDGALVFELPMNAKVSSETGRERVKAGRPKNRSYRGLVRHEPATIHSNIASPESPRLRAAIIRDWNVGPSGCPWTRKSRSRLHHRNQAGVHARYAMRAFLRIAQACQARFAAGQPSLRHSRSETRMRRTLCT